MADEQVIGVARLRLEAEIKDFETGMKKAREELSRGEASFAKFTEKGEKSGARLLAAEEELNRELAKATQSSTATQLAEIDSRAAKKAARLRKAGVDEARLAQLEVEIHRQKHRALLREEMARTEAEAHEMNRRHNLRRQEVGDVRGSNAVLVDTSRRTRAEMRLAGETAGQSRSHFNATRQATLNLTSAFGAQAGAAGKVAGALSNLALVGLNPVALAVTALAVTIGHAIQKHQEQVEAAKAATKAYEEQRAEIRRWQSEIEAARAGTTDADERSLTKEIETKEKRAEVLQEEYSNLLASGKMKHNLFYSEMNEKKEAIKALKDEIPELYRRRAAIAANREEQERQADVEAAAARNREFEALAERGREAHRRQMEREDAAVEAAQREELYQHEKRRKAALQEIADFEEELAEAVREEAEAEKDRARLVEDLLDLRIETAKLALRADREDAGARLKVLELEEGRELARVDAQAADLRERARAAGQDLEALEEEIQANRTAIVKRFADERVRIEAEALGKIAQLQGEASGAYSTQQSRAIANDLYNAGFKMKDISQRLIDMGIDPESIGFGRAFVPGPAAVPSRPWSANTDPWAGAFIDPGNTPLWMTNFQQPVKVTVINNSSVAGVQAKPAPGGGVEILVADDIVKGGETTRALEERYPSLRGGA